MNLSYKTKLKTQLCKYYSMNLMKNKELSTAQTWKFWRCRQTKLRVSRRQISGIKVLRHTFASTLRKMSSAKLKKSWLTTFKQHSHLCKATCLLLSSLMFPKQHQAMITSMNLAGKQSKCYLKMKTTIVSTQISAKTVKYNKCMHNFNKLKHYQINFKQKWIKIKKQ